MALSKTKQKHAEIIEKTWPQYHVERILGSGQYGVVYGCVREDASGIRSEEAIKVIDLQGKNDLAEMEEMELDPPAYYEEKKQRELAEIRTMLRLEGSSHVVQIHDYAVVEKEDHPSCYILIRMPRMTSLKQLMKEHVDDSPAEAEAFAKKIALDICVALRHLHHSGREGTAHRDIKPDNILVSKTGEYCLGDFGFARILDSPGNLSYKGTPEFIAPEVVRGDYDHRVDIYSLGLVLYRVLNHNRRPFLPPYPQKVSPDEVEKADIRLRTAGRILPPPDNCSPGMAGIVLKMCEYDPKDRYQSAEEVESAFQSLSAAEKKAPGNVPAQNTGGIKRQTSAENQSSFGSLNDSSNRNGQARGESSSGGRESGGGRKKLGQLIAVLAACAVIIAAIFAGKNLLHSKNGSRPAAAEDQSSQGQPEEGSADGSEDSGKTDAEPGESGQDTSEADPSADAEEEQGDAAPAASKTINLASMKLVDTVGMGSRSTKDELKNSLGHVFEGGLELLETYFPENAGSFYVAEYSRIQGVISCPDGMGDGGESRLKIYADDNAEDPLLTVDIKRAMPETPFDLDISGAEFLTFSVSSIHDSNYNAALITDCTLTADGTSAVPMPDLTAPAGGQKLTGLEVVEQIGMGTESVQGDVENSLGHVFDGGLRLCESYFTENAARYYVRDYQTIRGLISCPDGMGNGGESRLKIYADENAEEPLLTVDIRRTMAEVPFELDISGAEFLTFSVSGIHDSNYNAALITNCTLE